MLKGYSIPKTNFVQKIAFALLLQENDKKQSKSKSRKPENRWTKVKFQLFEITDLLGHVIMT